MFDLSGTRIWVAGHRGMVGSAIWRALEARGDIELLGWPRSELDLADRTATLKAATQVRPDVVVLAAARVGGIIENDTSPVAFLTENLRIQANVMEAAHAVGVDRVLFLGSSCIYPCEAAQPMTPDMLITGPLEPTNDAYAMAKLAGITAVRSYRRQYGRRWISSLPTNLYGPGDDFDLETSHVLPALIRRLDEAARNGTSTVTLWGTGTPRREFLHIEDLAAACIHLLEHYDDPEPINIGCGEDLTIAELACLIAHIVGYEGDVAWDTFRPDGTLRSSSTSQQSESSDGRPTSASSTESARPGSGTETDTPHRGIGPFRGQEHLMTSSSPLTTPALLVTLNRPDLTREVLAAIREARPEQLFVASDGPRPHVETDTAKVAAMRALIEEMVDWPCRVERRFLGMNQGCRVGVSSAISWLSEHVEEGIILEDDCVPHSDFFGYCTKLLERYRHDEQVMNIAGRNTVGLSPSVSDVSYCFTRQPLIWGWATWRRAWAHYDDHLAGWKSLRENQERQRTLWSDPVERRWQRRKLDRLLLHNEPDTWDYQWSPLVGASP